jgi:hypothetical protein
MVAPYILKLFVFCSAFFFLVHGALALATCAAAPAAIRLAEKTRPRAGARFLFFLRIFPVSFALLSTLGLCAPSYLLFEPRVSAEHLNLPCSAAAILGLAICVTSISRGFYAMLCSARFARYVQQNGRMTSLPGQPYSAWVLSGGPPFLALSGIIHARLIFSRDVQLALSTGEFEAAMLHERSHRNSRDNLKRLLFLLAPQAAPFSKCFAALEQSWIKLSEWAADDDATRGDSQAALTLAQALIRVAQLGVAHRPPLSASLIAESNLSDRINRLLLVEPLGVTGNSFRKAFWRAQVVLGGAAILIAVVTIALKFRPAVLFSLHSLLELMIR